MFITVLTRAHYWSLSLAQQIQSTPSDRSWNSNLLLTHRYTILPETEKLVRSLTDQYTSMFLQKYKTQFFFSGYNILAQDAFLTQLSSNAGISVWRIVWVMTTCCFMSDIPVFL
jgi:hypothetical protein